MKVLVVVTSCDLLAPGHPTGVWFDEFAIPFQALTDAGLEITVVSPKGGPTPIDPKSAPSPDDHRKWHLVIEALESAGKLADVPSADGFDAIYMPGGHGPLVDLAADPDIIRLIRAFDLQGKPIAAICHGPAALLNVRDESGEAWIKGRKISGFSDFEEKLMMLSEVVPFLLEDALKERGTAYECSLVPFLPHVVRDGNLITGQNPASSEKIAEVLLEAINERSKIAQPSI